MGNGERQFWVNNALSIEHVPGSFDRPATLDILKHTSGTCLVLRVCFSDPEAPCIVRYWPGPWVKLLERTAAKAKRPALLRGVVVEGASDPALADVESG